MSRSHFCRRSTLCAGRSGVRLEPSRKLFLIHFTRRKAKCNVRRIHFRRGQVTGREVDGWTFWKYEVPGEGLKKLNTLRKEIA